MKGRSCIVAKCSRPNCTVSTFHGDPAQAYRLEFHHSCGCVSVDKITKEVCDQYKKLFAPVLTFSAEEAAYWSNFAPSRDPRYLTGEEMAAQNAARGATSELSPAKCGGFVVDRPHDDVWKKK